MHLLRACVSVVIAFGALCLTGWLPGSLSGAAWAQSGQVYEYDLRGRLVKITYEDQSVIEYVYDIHGNRTSRLVSEMVSFSVGDISASEGGGLSFTITKTGAASHTRSVDYATSNGSASSADYTSASGTATFAPTDTVKVITVSTLTDSIYEVPETVVFDLSNASTGSEISDSQALGTITNGGSGSGDGGGPEFSINDASVTEGGNLVFTVTKAGATSQTHTVNYATANDTASSGDYTATSGTLTFTSGQTTKTVTVTTTGDVIFEINETVLVNLDTATNGATISDSQGVGTIHDDDSGAVFTVNDVSVSEGGNLVFTVTKAGVTSQTHAVNYATANGTASLGDYTATSGTLTFTSGQTTKTVTVATTGDAIFEISETVLVNLDTATNGASISDTQGVGAINNDDAGPAFSINDVGVTEGGSLSFTVTKSGATSQSHAVNYATANGTAGSGDYTAASGTLTFGSGETTKTVTVATTSDAIFEVTESVLVNLSAATNGAMISDGQGVGAINNNSAGPAFSVNNVSVTEGGSLVFTVTKSGATSQSHAVNYATANGTAGPGDYTAASGALTFASGETTKTVNVVTTQDGDYEANETLVLNLSSATNSATISDGQGVGTINNDDAPNQAPTAVNDSLTMTAGTTVTISALANDSDPDSDQIGRASCRERV